MFERYTESARRTIFFGRYEASQFGSPEIESEHLLLGLLRASQGVLKVVLGNSLRAEDIRAAITEAVTSHPKTPTSVDLPFTNECKRILAYAAEEAMRLSHSHIGNEHILLGMLREKDCLAALILGKQGLELKKVRTLIADAKEQLATSDSAVLSGGVGSGSMARPFPRATIVDSGNPARRLRFPSRSNIPRIGDRIQVRDGGDSVESYRVQDVVWELDLDHGDPGATQLSEVRIHVVKEPKG